MRCVTYASPEGDRVGVLSLDRKIHALPPGVALVDLIGEGAPGLQQMRSARRRQGNLRSYPGSSSITFVRRRE